MCTLKEKPIAQKEYVQIIRCLTYLTNNTRPDIAYAIRRLSRYTSNPNEKHWTTITQVLKYLKGITDLRLLYYGVPLGLKGYFDTN